MNREANLQRLEASPDGWEIIVIGGGATGLGVALEAAARGYRTLLLEQHDFAKATSSRSTKLIHGGVRYLRQGNVKLVRESLLERGRLMRNAPHLVHPQAFVVPLYSKWDRVFYGAGLKLYDWMAGKLGLGASTHLSKDDTLRELPNLSGVKLQGGIRYDDGQFDDARLAVCLARTVEEQGGVVMNYMRVTRLLKERDRVSGVVARDLETDNEYTLNARVVINATGVFSDQIRRMDDPAAREMMTASQGIHLVLDGSFMGGSSALMVPKTDDGRVLFVIPWLGRVLAGTTDTPVAKAELEPRPLHKEVEYILDYLGRYYASKPSEKDVLSAFAGLRPLVKAKPGKATAQVPRDHTIEVSPTGLITIAGGKWTTYRKMAEDTIGQTEHVAGLPRKPSPTPELRLHGWTEKPNPAEPFGKYGSDAVRLESLIKERLDWGERLHAKFPHLAGETVWAVRYEMARTVEDVLARRLRVLMLDAQAAMEMAPKVAGLMAEELGRNKEWEKSQVERFNEVAEGYRLKD